MLRTRDPDAVGREWRVIRGLAFVLVALLAAGGALAQDSFWQGRPVTGDEPLPAALEAARSDAPLALWQVRVVGSTLRPRQNNVDSTAVGDGGCVYASAGSSSTVWNTPLYLPQGATVQTLRIYYNDTSATDLFAWFTVYDLYGDVFDEWVVTSSGTGGQGLADSAIINHTIDYALYSYVLNLRPNAIGSALQFCGARIFFDAPTEIFIDGFETGDTSRWSSVLP